MKRFLLKTTTYYDDGDPVPVSPPPPPPPPPVKTFTQEQVDKLMAEHRKGLQTQNQELVKQLEEIRSVSTLTQQQKDELDARITTLSQQHLTEQQKAAAEFETFKKKVTKDLEATSSEAKQWKGQFESVMVQNAIAAGAVAHKAANSDQMLDLLSSKAKVLPEIDNEGKPTGKFVVKIPVKVVDPKTKQPVILELPAAEAIGKMREDASNANLFLFDGKAGLGGNNHPSGKTGTGGTPDFASMKTEEYIKWKKENP